MKRITIICFVTLLIGLNCSEDKLNNPHDPDYVPSGPVNVQLVQTRATEITITWQNPDPNLGVRIERRKQGEVFSILATVSSQTASFVDSTVKANETYAYRLKALGSESTSPYMQDSIYVAFEAPGNLALQQVTDTSIRIDWSDNTPFELGFTVERRLDGQDWSVEFGPLSKDDTTYLDTGVHLGDCYHYRVYAFAENAITEAVEDSISHVLATPDEPQVTTVSPSALSLSWSYLSSLHHGIIVERRIDNSSWQEISRVTKPDSALMDAGLDTTGTYSYRIAAYSGSFLSDYSTEITVGSFHWKPHNIGTNVDLLSVYFLDEDRGWISGGGQLFGTSDGGLNWTNSPTEYTIDGLTYIPSIRIKKFFSNGVGWATTGYETILKTHDGGFTWQAFHIGDNEIIGGAYVYDENRLWVLAKLNATGEGPLSRVYYTSNGGQSWGSQVLIVSSSGYLSDVHFISSSVGFVCGSQSVWKSKDGGRSWTQTYEYTFPGIYNIYCLDFAPGSSVGWAFGLEGYLKTTDAGENWQEFLLGSTGIEKAMFLDESIGWAISGHAAVLRTDDGGSSWHQEKLPPINGDISALFFVDSTNGWLVGDNGLVLTFGDLQWVKL